MSQTSYAQWENISPPYPSIPGIASSVIEKANTNIYEPWVTLKVINDIFDAQARIELQVLINKNPGKNVSWPPHNPIIGIVYPS